MKKNKWPVATLCGIGLLGLVFILSSKAADEFDLPPDICDQATIVTQQIQINFDPSFEANNAINNQRDDFWQGYIPSIDLRFQSDIATSAAGSLNETAKYYCAVTVTSPQCSDYTFFEVMDVNNATSSGLMDIEVLDNDGSIDTNLKVEYYEVRSGAGLEPQFNREPSVRLKYTFERSYLGGLVSSVPEPIQLFPGVLVNDFGDVIGIDIGKDYDFGDYGSVNNYIELNNINPE